MKPLPKNRLHTRSSMLRMAFPCAVTLSLLAAIPAARAATATWDGATNTNWNADNWSGGGGTGGAPVAGDALYFQGNTNTSTNNNFTAGTLFGEIRFLNDGTSGKTAGFTLDGSDIGTSFGFRLSTSSTAITDTVNLNIAASATGPNKVWFVGANRTLVLNGVLSGPMNSLAIRDGGTVELNNVNNSFTQASASGIDIANGTVIVGANAPSGANGALGNSTKNVNLGGGAVTPAGAKAALLISGTHTVGRNITAGATSDTDAFTSTVGGSNTSDTAT